ncbi:MAG: hypothetical protein AAGL49_03860, partial [Pseudomonadota bacterium]
MSKEDRGPLSRRDVFRGAAALGAAGLAAGAGGAQAATPGGPDEIAVAADGNYATVDLAKPAIRLTAVQSRVRAVDLGNSWKNKRSLEPPQLFAASIRL